MLGKNPTSVQNAITLAQKKDTELCIIEGLHNHDSGHEVNNIYNKQNDTQNNMGPCHACNGPHLIKDCNESICNRCKPNLDNHTPAKCPRKRPPNKEQKSNPSYTNNNIRSQSNGHSDPNVQLSIFTSKPDHIAELLEATRKITRYFKSHINTTKHSIVKLTVTTPVQTTTMQFTHTNTNASH